MKKLWIKLSIFLVAVVALPMFIPGPDGRPIMSLDDWIPSDLISGAGETLGHLSGVVGSKGVLEFGESTNEDNIYTCLLYTSPSPRDLVISRMPSSA